MPYKYFKIGRYLHWISFILSGVIAAFFMSWMVLAKSDFSYSWLHDVIDIGAHTQKYGPKNRNREDFEFTTKTERVRLFSEINLAIHNNGQGLKDISYVINGQHSPTDTLLHQREIAHLKDVARLISLLYWVGTIASIIWLALALMYLRKWLKAPTFKQQLVAITSLLITSNLLIIVVGPKNLFYWLHEMIFPAQNQWHFFYQDSLMTILMKAPDLFGYIAIELGLMTIAIYLGINYLQTTINSRHC
ncbi:DUF1461 domain-containing protein [Paraferrimonas sp. SM1919]|uniref:lipoprotein intramolecular transacylase Lit n=1 Tax=Paraferrimonas sp. SM1919 TaxID=2662263 RepID=UPI0013D2ADE0|nr:DUF1461 domain-containing protein [Paraferrimonas sp. SM1919]